VLIVIYVMMDLVSKINLYAIKLMVVHKKPQLNVLPDNVSIQI